MKFWQIGVIGCLTAALCSGCVSIGNQGWNDLSTEDQQAIKDAFAEAKAEVATAWQDAQGELRRELEETNWAEALLEAEEDERPRKLLWTKAGNTVENEIVDQAAFADSLSLEDWELSEETTDGLQEEIVYTVQQKKSVGKLDGKKEDYGTIGSIVVYEDSDLVCVTVSILEETLGDVTRWFLQDDAAGYRMIYQVPEEDLKILRQQ